MLVKFYHLRDEENTPWVTKCLKKDGNNIARGTAICSLEEGSPCKKIGRMIAEGRADKAMKRKESTGEVLRLEANIMLGLVEDDIIMKSEFNPSLTEYERILLS